MAVQSFSYEIAQLLTKYARRWANCFLKTLKFLEKHSLGIDTIFATMSDPQFAIFSPVFRYSCVFNFACSFCFGNSFALAMAVINDLSMP